MIQPSRPPSHGSEGGWDSQSRGADQGVTTSKQGAFATRVPARVPPLMGKRAVMPAVVGKSAVMVPPPPPSAAAAVGKSAMLQAPPAAAMGKSAMMQAPVAAVAMGKSAMKQAPPAAAAAAVGKSAMLPAATGKSAAMASMGPNGGCNGGDLPKSRTWDPATGKYIEEDLPVDLQELMSGSR